MLVYDRRLVTVAWHLLTRPVDMCSGRVFWACDRGVASGPAEDTTENFEQKRLQTSSKAMKMTEQNQDAILAEIGQGFSHPLAAVQATSQPLSGSAWTSECPAERTTAPIVVLYGAALCLRSSVGRPVRWHGRLRMQSNDLAGAAGVYGF